MMPNPALQVFQHIRKISLLPHLFISESLCVRDSEHPAVRESHGLHSGVSVRSEESLGDYDGRMLKNEWMAALGGEG